MASNDNLRYIVITAMPTAWSGSFACWHVNYINEKQCGLQSNFGDKTDMQFHK